MEPSWEIEQLLNLSLEKLRGLDDVTSCNFSLKGPRKPELIQKKKGYYISFPFTLNGRPVGNINLTISQHANLTDVFSSATNTLINTLIQKLIETRREKDYMEAILHGISHRIMLIDRDFKILCANKAALREGTSLKDTIGFSCYEKFEKRSSSCTDCPATVTFKTGRVVHIERPYHKEDINPLIFKISSYPVFDNKGRVSQTIISCRDVTEIHKVEQIKNDLMRMLAHDIRNPLLAATQTLDNCVNSSIYHIQTSNPLRGVLGETRDNCELLLNMIDDILDIYRYDGDKFTINRKEVDISRVIRSAINLVGTLTKDKDVKIIVRLPAYAPPFMADENRLIRVLINLLENAIMYSPLDGKISVVAGFNPGRKKILKRYSADIRPHVRISITDHGIGIPFPEIEKIFEKYYQGEREKEKGKIGLGLGLPFCRQTVEAHGGRIWAESPIYKGRGSRFVFTLPLSIV